MELIIVLSHRDVVGMDKDTVCKAPSIVSDTEEVI